MSTNKEIHEITLYLLKEECIYGLNITTKRTMNKPYIEIDINMGLVTSESLERIFLKLEEKKDIFNNSVSMSSRR